MNDGFIRIACATPEVEVADCNHNAKAIVTLARQAALQGAAIALFPELCITAYTCGDLFLQQTLLDEAEAALDEIARETQTLPILLIVGLPIRHGAALYNCAAVMCRGELLGLVPKRSIPNYGEFYEQRHFTPGSETPLMHQILEQSVPLGGNLLFTHERLTALRVGVEICEDLWVPTPPSAALALGGATLIVNPSASSEIVGKADFRRQLVQSQSARLVAGYAYADAGLGESTTDLIFSGHNLICENGTLLSESKRYEGGLTLADVDVLRLDAERRRISTFQAEPDTLYEIPFDLPIERQPLIRPISKMPFVPSDPAELAARCEEILTMQALGLATRLRRSKAQCATLALSGGLDSTLALIVTARAFDRLGWQRKDILAVTMPGFGTTARTRGNADALAEAYGATLRVIPIHDAVSLHFRDIGHDPSVTDVTYENAQARERTQIVIDLANECGGLMVGTGDLSELALGWATYNGDHMSMYAVNAAIPKTLVRHLVAYAADKAPDGLAAVLRDILATPVSPELLPPKDGEIAQITEELVGPYELHDFFLYYTLRFGFPPEKIYRLARHAFGDAYAPEVLKTWLLVFLRRFISQQFKRSCMPDGPKVGSISLSPRGDFRMPSDASAAAWLRRAEAIDPLTIA